MYWLLGGIAFTLLVVATWRAVQRHVVTARERKCYHAVESWLKSVGHYENVLNLQGTDREWCIESLHLYRAGWRAGESATVVGALLADAAHQTARDSVYGLVFLQELRKNMEKRVAANH